MTPAQAMFEALQLSFEQHGVALRKPWREDDEDLPSWKAVATGGLVAARASYQRGARSGGLAMTTAAVLADVFWRRCTTDQAPNKEHAGRELVNHWLPAANALIAAARSDAISTRLSPPSQTKEKETA